MVHFKSDARRMKACLAGACLLLTFGTSAVQAVHELRNQAFFQLASMGFPRDAVIYAMNVANQNLDEALHVLRSRPEVSEGLVSDTNDRHLDNLLSWGFDTLTAMKALSDHDGKYDAALNQLIGKHVEVVPPETPQVLENDDIFELASMGYKKDEVLSAMKEANGDVNRAMEILFETVSSEGTLMDKNASHPEILRSWGFGSLDVMKALTDNEGQYIKALESLVDKARPEVIPIRRSRWDVNYEQDYMQIIQQTPEGPVKEFMEWAMKERGINPLCSAFGWYGLSDRGSNRLRLMLALTTCQAYAHKYIPSGGLRYFGNLTQQGYGPLETIKALAENKGEYYAALRQLRRGEK